MTKTQQAYIDALNDNLDLAREAGLLVETETEDCGHFLSVNFKVKHDRANIANKRYGHDNEVVAYLIIGKRGKVSGFCRVGSLFSECRYCHDDQDATNRRIFAYLANSKFASDIASMVEFAYKHNEQAA